MFLSLNLLNLLRVEKDMEDTDLSERTGFHNHVLLLGTHGSQVSVNDKDNGILKVKWVGNNVVTVASSQHGVNPFGQVKKYNHKDTKIVSISPPCVIK